MRYEMRVFALMMCALLVMGMFTGCKRSKPIASPFGENGGLGSANGAGGMGSGAGTGDLESGAGLENAQFAPASWLQTVYFEYDSAALRSDAMATLQSNAAAIKSRAGVRVQCAGHCDARGTQEYNLALGERRAQSVRMALIQLGVPGSQLVTTSFGKEQPAVPGDGESAWAKNRRVEFYVAR